MERITDLGMDPDPIDAVLVSGAKRPGKPPHLKIRPFVQGAAEHWHAVPNGTRSGPSPTEGGVRARLIHAHGSPRVRALNSSVSAMFERTRLLVTTVTVHTLRREILTCRPLWNAGIA